MGRQRDTQRSKVYRAEQAACRSAGVPFSTEIGINNKMKFDKYEHLEDCAEFIMSVCLRKRVQAKYPNALMYARTYGKHTPRGDYRGRVYGNGLFPVGDGHGQRKATWDGSKVNLPRWARTEHVMLHELAHALSRQGASHGWQFAECLLFLWKQVFGAEKAKHLEASYKANKVKYRKPRAKRQITPEQRAILVERMAKARLAKQMNQAKKVA